MMRSLVRGFGISISGSLPVGIMNMAALQVSLEQGITEAIGFALTAVLIEGVIITVTGNFGEWINAKANIMKHIEWSGIVLLILIGLYFLSKAILPAATQQINQTSVLPGWQYGAWLRIINPTALLFWLGVHITLAGQKSEGARPLRVPIFAVGGMIGTLTAYGVYIGMAEQLSNFLRPFSVWLNVILGVFCILAGIWRLKNLISKK
jgi:threonine/homoserine/homoserine lactone efflux protein